MNILKEAYLKVRHLMCLDIWFLPFDSELDCGCVFLGGNGGGVLSLSIEGNTNSSYDAECKDSE